MAKSINDVFPDGQKPQIGTEFVVSEEGPRILEEDNIPGVRMGQVLVYSGLANLVNEDETLFLN